VTDYITAHKASYQLGRTVASHEQLSASPIEFCQNNSVSNKITGEIRPASLSEKSDTATKRLCKAIGRDMLFDGIAFFKVFSSFIIDGGSGIVSRFTGVDRAKSTKIVYDFGTEELVNGQWLFACSFATNDRQQVLLARLRMVYSLMAIFRIQYKNGVLVVSLRGGPEEASFYLRFQAGLARLRLHVGAVRHASCISYTDQGGHTGNVYGKAGYYVAAAQALIADLK